MPEYDSTIEYRDVPDFPRYKVGSDGSVWSCGRGEHGRWRRMNPTGQTKSGHLYVSLRRGGVSHRRRVHRLVLQAFVGPCPEGMEARHYPDRDPTNNRPENLSWATHTQNMSDKLTHGTHNRGERQGASKLDVVSVLEIRRRRKAGECGNALAGAFGVSQQAVCDIVKRRRWAHLPEED